MQSFLPYTFKKAILPVIIFLLFMAIVAFLATPRSLGAESLEGTNITAIAFEGLQNLKEADLQAQVQSKPGTPYSAERVAADIKRLARTASEVEARRRTTEGGVEIVFLITENPKLAAINIVGNSQVKTTELERATRVRPGTVLTRDAVVTAREGVLKEYRDRGFMRTEVTADLARTPEGEAVLQILVNEGKKLRVQDLVLQGNKHFSTFRIKASMETKGSWAMFENFFDEAAFDADLQNIRTLYENAGFFSVKVERGRFLYDESQQLVTPVIQITEGPRYRLGEIRISGNTFFTREEVEAPFQGLLGKPFDAKDFALALDKVRALYQNAGYITTEIAYPDVDLDPEKGEVGIPLHITEQSRVRVGRILVERPSYLNEDDRSWFGKIYNSIAPPVSEETVRQQVTLKPGDVYQKKEEIRSEEQLRRLGIFDTVEIESRSTDDQNVRDVLVRVDEGVTGNILLGVGFSDAYGVYTFANYTERNLFGEAGDLRANVMLGTKVINGSISYFDRQLGNSDYSLYSEIHHERARRPGYREINTGIKSELGKPLNEQWRAYLQGRLEFVNLDEEGNPRADFDRSYPVLAARLRFTHDSRGYGDSLLPASMPVSGHLAGFGFEAGYADGPLAKLTGSLDWYQKLGGKLVFATGLSGGFMPVDAEDIGPTERFYMGGTEDLRGFAFRRAGPHDSRDDDVPLGGATKVLARNELRYPIVDKLTGLVFVDAGMLSEDAFSLGSPRASTGLGLRLNLKGVQAGADLALPFLKGSDDQTRFFHFSLNGLKGF